MIGFRGCGFPAAAAEGAAYPAPSADIHNTAKPARFFAQSPLNLYRAGNPADLARKIDFMIEHPEIRQELKDNYVEYAERFRIDKCIDKMEEMFEDAAAHRHPGGMGAEK